MSVERRNALYASKEGPLLAWLIEEAQLQGLDPRGLAERLGVTYGYVAQLRLGIRKSEHISDDFSRMCAYFLGVPTVIVKLLSGRIKVNDFAVPRSTKARRHGHDSQANRPTAAFGPKPAASQGKVTLRVQDAMLALFEEVTGHEVVQARQLPEIMSYLRRAAVIHRRNGVQM